MHTARGSTQRLITLAFALSAAVLACAIVAPMSSGATQTSTPTVQAAQAAIPDVVGGSFRLKSNTRKLGCKVARVATQRYFDDKYTRRIDCNLPQYAVSSRATYNLRVFGFYHEQFEVRKTRLGGRMYRIRAVCRQPPLPDFEPNPDPGFVPCQRKVTAAAQAAGLSATAASTKKEVRSQKQSSGLSCLAAKASAAKAFPRQRFTIKSRRTDCDMYADIPNSAIVVTTRWDYIVTKVQRGHYPFRYWMDIVDREVHVSPIP